MASILDADTHILEPREMWEFFDKEMYHRRPVIVSAPDDTLYKPRKIFWLIDGNLYPKDRREGWCQPGHPGGR